MYNTVDKQFRFAYKLRKGKDIPIVKLYKAEIASMAKNKKTILLHLTEIDAYKIRSNGEEKLYLIAGLCRDQIVEIPGHGDVFVHEGGVLYLLVSNSATILDAKVFESTETADVAKVFSMYE